MANTTYTPRFSAISEGKDMVRIYAVINYTCYQGTNTGKKVIRFAVRNLITGKSYKVRKALWDKDNNRCHINRGTAEEMKECRLVNSMMKTIVKAVSDIVDDYTLRKIVFSPSVLTEEKIYETICKIDEITTPKNKNILADYWLYFIEKAKRGEERHNGNRYNERTIRAYQKCLNSLLAYQEEVNHIYTFDEINNEFYSDYTTYLEKRLRKNSICEQFKKMKHIMNLSLNNGLHSNTAYNHFSTTEEEVDNIYMTEEELVAISELDLTNSRLDKYRDIFLIGCYVGLRVGDLLRIRKEHFYQVNGVEMLKIRTTKCPKDIHIPFLWKDLKYRLEKYDYNLPRISEQHLRKEAKEVGRLAGINTPILIEAGRYKRDKAYEKWELIGTHTCRRTACTNMFKRGIPVKQIMMISGHKKESTFYKYIKITEEENAIMLAQKFGML